MSDRDPQTANWHWDKRVPIVLTMTIVIGVIAQTAGISFWVGRISSQTDQNTQWIRDNAALPINVVRLQTQYEAIMEALARIEGQRGYMPGGERP